MTPVDPGAAASPAAVLARRLPADRSIAQMRALMLGGYGTGASDALVTAVTRDRVAIGDTSTLSRRARTAKRTQDARNGVAGIPPHLSSSILRALVTIGGPVIVIALVRILRRRARPTANAHTRRS